MMQQYKGLAQGSNKSHSTTVLRLFESCHRKHLLSCPFQCFFCYIPRYVGWSEVSQLLSIECQLLKISSDLLVGALPATATVTLFEATPTVESVSAVSGATSEIDVSILGVSSGSAGTETTYSIGIYQSMPANTATESGSLVTVVPTTVHGVAVTQNCEQILWFRRCFMI